VERVHRFLFYQARIESPLAYAMHLGHTIFTMAKKDITKAEQVFSFNAPAAMSVLLVGDFTHWQKNPVSLKKDDRGVWKAKVALEAGTHHYRFLVDGEWRDDPECTLRVPNPFGSQNAVRHVR
jgi:1,4-alpha-glucan branching enzyme